MLNQNQTSLTTVTVYCNIPKSQINRLQQIQNYRAHTVVKAPKFSDITSILRSLHWLKINERIEHKLSGHRHLFLFLFFSGYVC